MPPLQFEKCVAPFPGDANEDKKDACPQMKGGRVWRVLSSPTKALEPIEAHHLGACGGNERVQTKGASRLASEVREISEVLRHKGRIAGDPDDAARTCASLRFASAARKFDQVNTILGDFNGEDDVPSSLTLSCKRFRILRLCTSCIPAQDD